MTCAKNCKNWWKCIKAIASQTWDIFWDTVYICCNRSVDHNTDVEQVDWMSATNDASIPQRLQAMITPCFSCSHLKWRKNSFVKCYRTVSSPLLCAWCLQAIFQSNRALGLFFCIRLSQQNNEILLSCLSGCSSQMTFASSDIHFQSCEFVSRIDNLLTWSKT